MLEMLWIIDFRNSSSRNRNFRYITLQNIRQKDYINIYVLYLNYNWNKKNMEPINRKKYFRITTVRIIPIFNIR